MSSFIIINNATDFDTAAVAHNYPYGRYRTDKKYWVDHAVKGIGKGRFRAAECTLKPGMNGTFGKVWNKPHYGIFHDLALLAQIDNPGGDNNGYYQFLYCDATNSPADIIQFARSHRWKMSPLQKEALTKLYGKSRTCNASSWNEELARATEEVTRIIGLITNPAIV